MRAGASVHASPPLCLRSIAGHKGERQSPLCALPPPPLADPTLPCPPHGTRSAGEAPVLSDCRGGEAARAGARTTCRADENASRTCGQCHLCERNGGTVEEQHGGHEGTDRVDSKVARAIVRTRRMYVRTYAARCAVMGYVMDDRTGVRRSAPGRRRRREPSSGPAKVRVRRPWRIHWCISATGAVISFPLAHCSPSLPIRSPLPTPPLFPSLPLPRAHGSL